MVEYGGGEFVGVFAEREEGWIGRVARKIMKHLNEKLVK